MRLAILVFLTACVSLFASGAQALTLSGKVYGGSSPLADVTISVFDTSSSAAIAIQNSDAQGGYQFELEPGIYRLAIDPPQGGDYGASSVSAFALDEDEIRNVILLTQAATNTLSGTVTLPDGTSPEEVYLTAYNDDADAPYRASTQADENGHYSMTLVPGVYRLGVSIHGYGYSQSRPIGEYYNSRMVENLDLSADVEQDVVLPYMTLSGVTTDSSGVPVAGVSIRFNTEDGFYSLSATSDNLGRYALLTTANTYDVYLYHEAESGTVSRTDYKTVEVSADTDQDYIIDLITETNILSGTITFPDGTSPEEVYLNAYNNNVDWSSLRLIDTST